MKTIKGGECMKNGKRPTVRESRYLQSLKLSSENWLISKKQSDKWLLIHKLTGRAKEIVALNKLKGGFI